MCQEILKTIIEWVWLLSCQERWNRTPKKGPQILLSPKKQTTTTKKNCTRIGVGIFHWLISLRFKLNFEVHKSESKKTKTNSSQFYLLTVVQALFNIWKKRHDVQRRILLSARSRADRTASSWSSLFWLNKAVGIPQNRKPILNPFLYFLHVRVVIFMLVE